MSLATLLVKFAVYFCRAIRYISLVNIQKNSNLDINGLHITSRRPCWRHNTKEYVISSIVGSSYPAWVADIV